MLYADRALSPADDARVAKLVAEDPALRARLEQFTETGRELSHLFDSILRAPVPPYLVDTVLHHGREEGETSSRTRPAPASSPGLLGRWLSWTSGNGIGWGSAVAFGTLLVGAAIGWFAHGFGTSGSLADGALLAVEDGQLFARGQLAQFLETAQSGKPILLEAGGFKDMLIRVTYRTQGQNFCREYELTRIDGNVLAGIGCRSADGSWQVTVNGLIGAAKSATPRAGIANDTKAALNAVIQRVSESDGLDREMEDDILKRKWKP